MTTTLDEFEQYNHHKIPAYLGKEEVGMIGKEIETLKEENNQLNLELSKKKILTNSLTEKLNDKRIKKIWQTETRKHQFRQCVSLETRNRFAPLQNNQDWLLDKEAKIYKEKEIFQNRHQMAVYSKQNHRPNSVINSFSGNDNSFWRQKTLLGNNKYSEAMRNGKKTFVLGTGATLKHLNYYVVPSLVHKAPDKIILHGGWCQWQKFNSKKVCKRNKRYGDTMSWITSSYHWWSVEEVSFKTRS